MSVILARSPYFIVINENMQTAARVELYIWNKGDSEPVSPTRVLEKSIVSTLNRSLEFNISPYLLNFIDIEVPSPIANNSTYPIQENDNSWCLVRVKSYYKTNASSEWELSTDVNFAAVNGYSYYTEGINYSPYSSIFDISTFILANNAYKRYIEEVTITPYLLDYFNVIINHDGFSDFYAEYTFIPGGIIPDEKELMPLLSGDDPAGFYNFCIPYIYKETNPIVNTYPYSTVEIKSDSFVESLPIISVEQLCEPKYTPVRCQFVNRLGGWDSIWFFKAMSEQYDVTNSNYQLAQTYQPNFNGQTKQFNFNAKQSIKLNTGWVDEEFSTFILDLLTSQQIWLYFEDIGYRPVTVKSKSQQKKTYIKDKNINYEIEFEYNYNVINDQI